MNGQREIYGERDRERMGTEKHCCFCLGGRERERDGDAEQSLVFFYTLTI